MSSLAIKILLLLSTPLICWVVLHLLNYPARRIFNLHHFRPFTVRRKLWIPTSLAVFFIGLSYATEVKVFLNELGLIYIDQVIAPFLIISIALLLSHIVHLLVRTLLYRFDIKHEDNLRNRKIRTQLQFIEKIVLICVWLIAVALVFLSFDALKTYGKSILASAGVAGVIIGLAAQKSLSNLIAGFQIAFTQPVRIDDAVLIEGEWGWVEEISLTYLVVKLWDRRRLILPINYIFEKPIQNWTRNSADIIGTIFLYVNYSVDIDQLRQAFFEILDNNELWDKHVRVLQVVELQENALQLRALMSAKNSPTAWDLRCHVREELVKYLQKNYSSTIPKFRVELQQ